MSVSVSKMLLTAVLWLAVLGSAVAQGRTPTDWQDNLVFRELNKLVKRHYPKADCTVRPGQITFEFNTRLFMVHVPLKTGEWQEAREVPGPRKGGVLGRIQVREGKYVGCAFLPQTFDSCYFSDSVSVAYSKKCDRHLYIHLCMPKHGRNEAFMAEFRALMDSPETVKALCDLPIETH